MVSRHPGSCHCGGVRFTLDSDPIELTTCDCSLCVKRNALMVKVPEVALHIEQGEQLLSLYVWTSGRAKHYFCRRCGIYVFHRKGAAHAIGRASGRERGVQYVSIMSVAV